MIIDGFDYWAQFSQDFSDHWFKTLCPDNNQSVNMIDLIEISLRTMLEILFIMK